MRLLFRFPDHRNLLSARFPTKALPMPNTIGGTPNTVALREDGRPRPSWSLKRARAPALLFSAKATVLGGTPVLPSLWRWCAVSLFPRCGMSGSTLRLYTRRRRHDHCLSLLEVQPTHTFCGRSTFLNPGCHGFTQIINRGMPVKSGRGSLPVFVLLHPCQSLSPAGNFFCPQVSIAGSGRKMLRATCLSRRS